METIQNVAILTSTGQAGRNTVPSNRVTVQVRRPQVIVYPRRPTCCRPICRPSCRPTCCTSQCNRPQCPRACRPQCDCCTLALLLLCCMGCR